MLRLALTLQLLHLLYHQVTTLCDLYPFNGVRFSSRGERFGEAAVNLVLMGLPPVGFILGVPILREFGTAFYCILFAAECATWWVPYCFGGSPKWNRVYARIQRPTITVLPGRGDHPVPNLEHLILMALTLVTAATTFTAYRSFPDANFPHRWPALAVGLLIVGGALYQTTFDQRWKPSDPPKSDTA